MYRLALNEMQSGTIFEENRKQIEMGLQHKLQNSKKRHIFSDKKPNTYFSGHKKKLSNETIERSNIFYIIYVM